MTLLPLVDWAARITIAFYFLAAAWFNFRSWDHHVAEFDRIGVSPARPALATGLLAMTIGSILLLIPATAVWGGVLLIFFTLGASALFHRYWTYPTADERSTHQQILFENIAHVGGLLAVVALRLT